jgi:hypothetical protein
MPDEQPQPPTDSPGDLEREIRQERKFSLSEAIGRLAGPGMMKGVSPVSPHEQAQGVIREYLECHLTDSAGVLRGVLARQVNQSEVLLSKPGEPLAALATYVGHVLDSEFLLKELVREADVEWGRVFGERPHFEKPGRPPDPDDPYTHASVRAALTELLGTLSTGPG